MTFIEAETVPEERVKRARKLCRLLTTIGGMTSADYADGADNVVPLDRPEGAA